MARAAGSARQHDVSQLLIVGWAPTREGQEEPFAADTDTGRRLRELMGENPARVATLANLLDAPPEDGPPDTAAAGARASQLLSQYPEARLLLLGRDVSRSFGIERELGRNGYLVWFLAGGRLVGVMPHPSWSNRWWNEPTHENAARLFLRQMIGAAPLATHPGEPLVAIEPEELERLGALPITIAQAAKFLRVSESTLMRRLREPLYREAWEAGRAQGVVTIASAARRRALSGNTILLLHLLKTQVGLREDTVVKLELPSAYRKLSITREEAADLLRQVAISAGMRRADLPMLSDGIDEDDGLGDDPVERARDVTPLRETRRARRLREDSPRARDRRS